MTPHLQNKTFFVLYMNGQSPCSYVKVCFLFCFFNSSHSWCNNVIWLLPLLLFCLLCWSLCGMRGTLMLLFCLGSVQVAVFVLCICLRKYSIIYFLIVKYNIKPLIQTLPLVSSSQMVWDVFSTLNTKTGRKMKSPVMYLHLRFCCFGFALLMFFFF